MTTTHTRGCDQHHRPRQECNGPAADAERRAALRKEEASRAASRGRGAPVSLATTRPRGAFGSFVETCVLIAVFQLMLLLATFAGAALAVAIAHEDEVVGFYMLLFVVLWFVVGIPVAEVFLCPLWVRVLRSPSRHG